MTTYTFSNRKSGREWRGPLQLRWEARLDPISDDYSQDEITAEELMRLWVRMVGKGKVPIYWFVEGDGAFEAAPFTGEREDFLTHYTWPRDADTGEPVKFSALPVVDKLWRREQVDKGGFIQEATGWKPSAFQSEVDVDVLLKAAGLTV